MLLDASQSQLVLVDYQERLMPVIFDHTAIVANARILAQTAHLLHIPTVGTEQNPSRLGANDAALRALCQHTLAKMHFSAVEEGLLDVLRPAPKPASGSARSLPRHLQKNTPTQPGRNQIVIAGCEAHVCLLQTALQLLEEECEVWVVTDACGSHRTQPRCRF